MNHSQSSLGCAAMSGAIIFSIGYIWCLIAAVLDGKQLNGRIIDDALSVGGGSGCLVFFLVFVLVANDEFLTKGRRKKIRQKLLERSSQSDEDFCSKVPVEDRELTIRLRNYLGDLLDVPSEKLHSTDTLHGELEANGAFEAFYTEALGGHTIYEVPTDEVLDIVDNPDHTVPHCAKQIRLLTEWTARQRDQNFQDDDKLPT
jgi:hypothetical protein